MAANSGRERRPALWPYLVMPLIVLLAFCALNRVHQRPGNFEPPIQSAPAAAPGGQ